MSEEVARIYWGLEKCQRFGSALQGACKQAREEFSPEMTARKQEPLGCEMTLMRIGIIERSLKKAGLP